MNLVLSSKTNSKTLKMAEIKIVPKTKNMLHLESKV